MRLSLHSIPSTQKPALANILSIKVNDADAQIKTVALIAAISEDCGLEGYSLHPKSISTQEFFDFVENLSQ